MANFNSFQGYSLYKAESTHFEVLRNEETYRPDKSSGEGTLAILPNEPRLWLFCRPFFKTTDLFQYSLILFISRPRNCREHARNVAMAFINLLTCSFLFHSRLLIVLPTLHLKPFPMIASMPFSDIFTLLAGLFESLWISTQFNV